MRDTPETILSKLTDVLAYLLDEAEAKRRQGGAPAPLAGRLPPGTIPFDTPAPLAKDEPLLLTVQQVAAILTISERSVYRLADAGVLPVRRFGRSLRFSRAAIERFIEQEKR